MCLTYHFKNATSSAIKILCQECKVTKFQADKLPGTYNWEDYKPVFADLVTLI